MRNNRLRVKNGNQPLMAESAQERVTVREEPFRRHRSLWSDAWRRFAHNRTALMGLFIVLIFAIAALFPSVIAPYNPLTMQLDNNFAPPSSTHPFGTDKLGRDVLSRIIHAARYDLGLTVITVSLTVVVGLSVGTVAAYRGGALDTVLMRSVDIMLAFPTFALGLALVVFLGPSMVNIILVLAITRFPRYARLIRGSVLTIKEREYVEAARMIGASHRAVVTRHILPNSIAPVIVFATLDLGAIIISLAGLSFLGVGIQPPTPDWGLMLTDARNNLVAAPWTAIFPGLAISLVVIGFNLMGDGLRDALDPRLQT